MFKLGKNKPKRAGKQLRTTSSKQAGKQKNAVKTKQGRLEELLAKTGSTKTGLFLAAFASLVYLIIFSQLQAPDLKQFGNPAIVIGLLLVEEIVFRKFLYEKIGAMWQLLAYALLMPLVYATQVIPYVAAFASLFILGLFATLLRARLGFSSALALKAFFLLFAYSTRVTSAFALDSLLLAIPFFFMLIGGMNFRQMLSYLELDKIGLRDVLSGLYLFAQGFIVVLAVMIALSLVGIADTNKVAEVIQGLDAYTLVLIVVLTPVAEETLFRGFLQKKIGVVFASIVFGALHFGFGSLAEVAGAFAISLVFGYYVRKNKRLIPSIIAHAMFNLWGVIAALYLVKMI
ncbi:CPBP family intramembrane metalloprotease [Candidatus Micrarchaeota archaeon]|nr:CPBP family intramembrane metalloprotease [Candidatus Micrarchaeota archaeon]